jgi:hypothetical protein
MQAPDTCYRAAMRRGGAGVGKADAARRVGTVRRLGGGLSMVLQPSHNDLVHKSGHALGSAHSVSLEADLAGRLKSRKLRFERRVELMKNQLSFQCC